MTQSKWHQIGCCILVDHRLTANGPTRPFGCILAVHMRLVIEDHLVILGIALFVMFELC